MRFRPPSETKSFKVMHMSTILKQIQTGDAPGFLADIAAREGRDLPFLIAGLLAGRIVVPKNNGRTLRKPAAIGEGLLTKINANIGTSPDHDSIEEELEKLRVAVLCGSDTVMDLSTGARIVETRRRVIAASDVPVGTVPMYEAAVRSRDKYKAFVHMTPDDLFEVIDGHGRDGVDFITVHCGATRGVVDLLDRQGRIMDIVSRGGALLVEWMIYHDRENPLYEHFDRLLEIALRWDMTLSLGDGRGRAASRTPPTGPRSENCWSWGS